ncbi:hypothetical protein BLOT_010521 [Blomia tropicalis]|nr:hypothetical protein BLOT_010521 [Blomia tropicalis]
MINNSFNRRNSMFAISKRSVRSTTMSTCRLYRSSTGSIHVLMIKSVIELMIRSTIHIRTMMDHQIVWLLIILYSKMFIKSKMNDTMVLLHAMNMIDVLCGFLIYFRMKEKFSEYIELMIHSALILDDMIAVMNNPNSLNTCTIACCELTSIAVIFGIPN